MAAPTQVVHPFAQRRCALSLLAGVTALLLPAACAPAAQQVATGVTGPQAEPASEAGAGIGYRRYAAAPAPDRIILTFAGDPATTQAVTWRTDHSVTEGTAQIAVATANPALEAGARSVRARSVPLETANGSGHHHTARFVDLEPNTLYAYRVGGGDHWSEWFHFRTAAATFEPFSFIYFGDAQNAVRSLWSRAIRTAYSDMPTARFMIHAGDLVNQRDENHDDEWGEWFEAGGWLNGMVPSIPATGNHEYEYHPDGDGGRMRVLSPLWAASFAVPDNGPVGLESSVYAVDYQGVRVIVLNSTEALTFDRAAEQAAWMEPLLRDNPNRWTVVVYHHPMFSVAQGRDNPSLREHWKPLFDRYRVDLVLQGHDHTYGRGSNLDEGLHAYEGNTGTMYVVSVAGPKMYLVSDEAREIMDRTAEDTQLYQIIHVEHDRLRFEARTVTGELYDAFDLARADDGRNRLVERMPDAEDRLCERPDIPGYRTDRCRAGESFSDESHH
jgi:acid phosphatase type 7